MKDDYHSMILFLHMAQWFVASCHGPMICGILPWHTGWENMENTEYMEFINFKTKDTFTMQDMLFVILRRNLV